MKDKLKERLIALIKEMSNNNFYKDKLDKHITDDNILEYYNNFPIIKKEDIIQNIDSYVSNTFRNSVINHDIHTLLTDVVELSNNHDKQLIINNQIWNIEFTTGSTGKPFPIIKSPKTRMIESIYLLKKRKEIFKKAEISNSFLFLHPKRKEILSIDLWKFNVKDMNYIVNDWIETPPKWIFGTPLIFYKYAEYIQKKNIDIFKEDNLKFIEYTSQSINDDQFDLIYKTFKCKIIGNYGSREFWNIAYQCVNENYHINDEYLIINVVDDNGNIIKDFGIVGNIVITNLINYDIPLFKYYLGDRAKIIKNNCTCGCLSDIIELVPEREIYKLKNTHFYGSNIFRRVMRGLYFHDYFNDIENIKIIQDAEYHLTVYVNKKQINDEKFENSFITRTRSIVPELYKFKVDFSYQYPFSNEDYRFKETIFKSIV